VYRLWGRPFSSTKGGRKISIVGSFDRNAMTVTALRSVDLLIFKICCLIFFVKLAPKEFLRENPSIHRDFYT
jgi:hypothetical protein